MSTFAVDPNYNFDNDLIDANASIWSTRKLSYSLPLPIQRVNQKKEDSPVPLTYLEQKRKEAQALYLEEQKYLEQNREHFEQLLEEERKAAAAQMAGNLFNVMASLGGPPPVLTPANATAQPANDSTASSSASASATEPPKTAQQLVSIVANPTGSSSKKQWSFFMLGTQIVTNVTFYFM